MQDYRGKVVWITGASSGIGEALAYELAERGATLVLSARRETQLERVRSACQDSGAHMILPLDLGESESFAAALASVLDRYGNIDTLINNGGISQRGTAVETQLEVDRRIMEVNYMGTVALTKAVLPSMLARGSGQIVVISSLMGKIGTPMRSAYAASKHALQGFFDCLRAEVHDQGVNVCVVCPGYIDTEVTQNALNADGSTHGKPGHRSDRSMSPATFAKRCVDVMERREDERMIGGREVLAAKFGPIFPRVYNFLVRKVKST